MFNPKTEPVSERDTAFVIAAVTMELIRQREQVRGNSSARKSDISLIKVWKIKTK